MRKNHNKKFRLVYVLPLLALSIGIGAVVLYLFNPSVGFTYYEPSYLPPHVSVKAKRKYFGPSLTQIEQNFRTEDWVYSIREYSTNNSPKITSIGTADQNYNPQSPKPTCSILASPAKVRYRVCHWIDYGRIDVHEIKFVKGNTFINALLPTTLDDHLSTEDINKFVDSFTRKSSIGLPVLRSRGA